MSTKCRFSIVIPVFNRYECFLRAIESVKNQVFLNYQVIVVDDGSTIDIGKKIRDFIHSLNDERYLLIQYADNKNGAYARNQGIAAASGDYICFLDSDDEWIPEKLDVIEKEVSKFPSVDVFYHQYYTKHGNEDGYVTPKYEIQQSESVAEYIFCHRVEQVWGGMQSSCLIVKRNIAKINMFNQDLRGHQDWDFVIRLGEMVNTFRFIKKPLTIKNNSNSGLDMVSRGLDYEYSLNFIKDYERYFSMRAKAAYGVSVLLPKRLRSNCPLLSCYELLGWLFYFKASFKYLIKVVNIHLRCLRLICKNLDKKNIAIMGLNDYTDFFMSHYSRYLHIVFFIDKNKKGLRVFHANVLSVDDITDLQWRKIDCVITMTDKHHASMTDDIRKHNHDVLIFNF